MPRLEKAGSFHSTASKSESSSSFKSVLKFKKKAYPEGLGLPVDDWEDPCHCFFHGSISYQLVLVSIYMCAFTRFSQTGRSTLTVQLYACTK